MMRYLKYIFLSLLSCILTMSCVKELDAPFYGDEVLTTLVPRVKSFTNQYVTKAYGNGEDAINSLSALIFDNDGKFVGIQSGTTSVTINKSMINSPANKEKLDSATIVMFANMSLDNITDADGKSIKENLSGLTLENIDGYTCKFAEGKTVITDLSSFTDGFPMVGRATGVNLTSTKAQQEAITVNLKILYAKITFFIKVENGTENTGTGMQFAMTGYSVHNVSKAIKLGEPEGATASSDYSYISGNGKTVNKSGTVALNGTPLTFTFYVAESRYEHNSDLTRIYPSDDWLTWVEEEDVKNYDSATDKAKLNGVKYFYDELIQQYKPKLADLDSGKPGQGLATYVLLKGTYTDYRGTAWTVSYKVYLGKDNALNFHVDRNSEYTNHITIKGIRNNDSHSNGDVWVDHRVNVSTTDPAGYVTITRETLIDAHIEVRPMRVKWDGDTYAGVRIYLPTDTKGNLLNWIGIERFTGANCQDSATYCYADGESTGKRRYFTTDLISELQTKEGEFGVQEDTDGNKFIYLQNGDCAWIYFDEHVSFKSYPTQPSPAREAVIKLEFFDDEGNKKEEIYNVKQLGLQRRGGYNVESYEEYLHSYDSADKYNLSTTPADYTQQGLSWGLENKVVSQDIIVSRAAIGSDIIKNLAESLFPDAKYDFFADDDKNIFLPDTAVFRYMKENGIWSSKSGDKETGLGFTNRATKNKIITVKDMGSAPENAYQYCLSKNKFEVDEKGNVAMKIHWYLPDVHQLAKVLNATAEGSSDFRSGDYYWSSQPSFTAENTYEWNTLSFGLLDEVPENARARSKGGNPKDFPRSSKNRIRCLYTQNFQEADMTGRTPDGIGGNYSFLMKGNLESGYFNNLLEGKIKNIPEAIETDYAYTDASYPYPTKANSYGVTGAEFGYEVDKDKNNNPIEGFAVNPQDNWSEYVIDLGIFGEYATGYYTTLNTYPGLSEMELEKFGRSALDYTIGNYTLLEIANRLNIDVERWLMIDAYKPKDTTPPSYKTDTQVLTSSSVIDLRTENLPQNANLKPLNDKLKISFGEANSEGNKPDFEYYELLSSTKQTNTRYWIPPTYNWTNHEMAGDSQTPTARDSASVTSTQIYTSESQAKDAAYTGVLGSGARPKAEANAISQLKTKISTEYPGYTYNESDIKCTEISVKYTTSRSTGWVKLWKATCDVVVEASVTVKKGGSMKLYTQVSGTGCWGEPVVGNKEPAGAEVTTDEFRMYGGNSFTITCTDPEYEITKVKIYYEGSSQISQSGLTTYHARFVDSQTAADLPIVGDETDHLRGMEYSESDGWQQWSGTGSDSVTMVLADYMIQAYYENWWEILTGAKYNYEYQVPDTGLSNYLVIERIEVKCTKKATASE